MDGKHPETSLRNREREREKARHKGRIDGINKLIVSA